MWISRFNRYFLKPFTLKLNFRIDLCYVMVLLHICVVMPYKVLIWLFFLINIIPLCSSHTTCKLMLISPIWLHKPIFSLLWLLVLAYLVSNLSILTSNKLLTLGKFLNHFKRENLSWEGKYFPTMLVMYLTRFCRKTNSMFCCYIHVVFIYIYIYITYFVNSLRLKRWVLYVNKVKENLVFKSKCKNSKIGDFGWKILKLNTHENEPSLMNWT